MRRLHRDEEGFALITAIAIMAVIALLLVVALDSGQAAFTNSEKGSRWTKTLSVAEAGINFAVTQVASNRQLLTNSQCDFTISLSPPCDPAGNPVTSPGTPTEGQFQWHGESLSGGRVEIQSVGYFPSKANAQFTRKIQILLEPVASFKYALFSNSTLELKNGATVNGNIYSKEAVSVGNASPGSASYICGSIENTQGGVWLYNNSKVVKSNPATDCTGMTAKVWSGGSITMSNNAEIEGNATASCFSGQSPAPSIGTSGIVGGTATACGSITGVTAGQLLPNTQTDPPAVQEMPSFTFDPSNYPGLHCYALVSNSTCASDPSNWSSSAVSSFNSGVSKSNMSGTYVIWQSNPGPATKVSLDGLSLSGDTTIITNAPIDLGNTSTVTTSVPADLGIFSTYIPPAGTDCSPNAPAYCSIFAKNTITFDNGDDADPNDGIAALLYTPGKMSFKNTGGGDSNADGALYAGSLDIKNGFDITYNGRIERMRGFGVGLEQTLWQEVQG